MKKMLFGLATLAVAAIGLGVVAIPAASAASTSMDVGVPAAAAQGVQTLSVLRGDVIDLTPLIAAGAYYGYEGAAGCVGYPFTYPDGSRYLGQTNCGPKYDPNATLSGQAIGLLIARIGSGPWFAVGGASSFTAGASGVLTLAYNDSYYPDNFGNYDLVVADVGGGSASGGGGGGGCINSCRL